jgi:hypothetical protein
MNWWTSIAFYLWRNSFRRWIEQPLVVLSKWVIAALIGMLGAVMIAGTNFLGEELERQLASRDALGVSIIEIVPPDQASALFSPDDSEGILWEKLAEESLVIYQVPVSARIDGMRDVTVGAMRDPERQGYPDTLILLTTRQPAGTMAVATMDTRRVEALAMPPAGPLLEKLVGKGEMLVASVARLAPLLQKGFTRQVLLQAKSLDAIEQIHRVTDVLQFVEQRRVTTRSTLPLLRQLREIRGIQGYVLLSVTLGTALVLGLICGALAWMEFREERYLLSLIRSFGVGRLTLLVHAVVENCLVAVTGVLLGLVLLTLAVNCTDLRAVKLGWLAGSGLVGGEWGWVLVFGAFCGGLLSCVPVGIGLRKPLGLVLK